MSKEINLPETLDLIGYINNLNDNQTPDYDYIRHLLKWLKMKNVHNDVPKRNEIDYSKSIKTIRSSDKLLAKKTKRNEIKKSSTKSDDKCCLSTADNISHKKATPLSKKSSKTQDIIQELIMNLSPKKSFNDFLHDFPESNIFSIYNIEPERKISFDKTEFQNFWIDY